MRLSERTAREFDSLLAVCIIQMLKASENTMLMPPNDVYKTFEEAYAAVSDVVEHVIGVRHEYHVVNCGEALDDLVLCARVLNKAFPTWEYIVPFHKKEGLTFENMKEYLTEWTQYWRRQIDSKCLLLPAIEVSLSRLVVAATVALGDLPGQTDYDVSPGEDDIAEVIEELTPTFEQLTRDLLPDEVSLMILLDHVKSITTKAYLAKVCGPNDTKI